MESETFLQKLMENPWVLDLISAYEGGSVRLQIREREVYSKDFYGPKYYGPEDLSIGYELVLGKGPGTPVKVSLWRDYPINKIINFFAYRGIYISIFHDTNKHGDTGWQGHISTNDPDVLELAHEEDFRYIKRDVCIDESLKIALHLFLKQHEQKK